MKSSRMIFALSLSASLFSVAHAAPTDDPVAFALKYRQASIAAKSPLDTNIFMSKRVLSKQKDSAPPKEMEAELAKLFKLLAGQVPQQVKVVKSSVKDGRASLELAAVDVPQNYKDMAKDAKTWSLKGYIDLVDEDNTWKVDRDIWKFSATTKNGNVSQMHGVPGPQDENDRPPTVASAAALTSTGSTIFNDFDSQVRDKLMDAVKKPGTSGQNIYALISLGPDGMIKGLKVRGEQPQPSGEQVVTNLLVAKQPFAPLPAKYKSQPNVWMTFTWSGSDSVCISGPYFSTEPHPKWLREKVGLK